MKPLQKTSCRLLALPFLLCTFFTFSHDRAAAQSMGISSSAITPDASSILEMRTTSKGLLIPRMTTTERDAITSPATGLMIYNTTTNKFNFYNGSSWTALFAGTSGVNSITGTSNRITIGGTAADPTVDISSGYTGQSSITTLGTISSGTWNGTIITSAYGGTGNGFTKFSGATTTEKTYTLPDASTTILTKNYTGTLATGILKSTTSTGDLSIAVSADFPTLNQNTTGSAATLTTSRNIYGNAFNGSADLTQIIASTFGGTGNGFTKFTGPATTEKTFTLPNVSATILTTNAAVTVAQGGTGVGTITGLIKGNGTSAFTAATAGTDYSVGTAALSTGILKSTTSTGALSIAVPADFPTLNQNTTGSAATLTTSRNIYGNAFNGSADLTQIIASGFGGTGNGFSKFTGATTTEKTYTLPDASTTIITKNYTGSLSTGIIKNTTATGDFSIAVAGTDYQSPLTSGTNIKTLFGSTLLGSGDAGIVPTAYGGTGLDNSTGGTANTFWARPNGATGAATYRAIVGADIPTLNQNTTGSAATLTTSRNIYGNAFNGSADLTQIIASTFGGTGNGFSKFTGATTTEKIYTLPDASTTILTKNYTGALSTGIVKNTNSTGELTIAVPADFPTLNQNTTGSAATLTTTRNIYGNAFNGSADLSQVIASTFGGTGNGFAKFTGPATTEKTFTLPNASANILTDNAAVTAAQGGTGNTSYTTGDLLYASGATTLTKLAGVATGNALISGGVSTAPSWGKIGLTTHVSGTLPIANGGTNSTATPTDGGIVYGDGTSYQVTAAGTAGQVLKSNGVAAPTWSDGVTIVTLGSDVVSNATANAIADVTGLSFSVTAGTTYRFKALVIYTSAATNTGSRWSISGPATPTLLAYNSQYSLTATSVTTNNAVAYDIPAASNASSASTAGNMAIIEGIIKPSASGTVTVRFASEIANSAITAKAGSTLTWW